MIKFLSIFVAALFISGCATTEIINRVPLPQSANSDQAQLKVCRQRIFYGDAAATIISLDRKPVLRSSAGKCFTAKLNTGAHVLGVMTQGPAGLEMGEFEFMLQKNTNKFLKVRMEKIQEITEQEIADFNEYEQIIVQ